MSEQGNMPSDNQRRRKRVQFFKKAIIALIIIAVILPVILCSILFVRMNRLERQMQELLEARAEEEKISVAEIPKEEDKNLSEREDVSRTKEVMDLSDDVGGDTSDGIAQDDGRKKVYLTFDDGPSPYTGTILDICQSYGVKVTFFVVGKTGTENEKLYRRIVDEGHTIGMHSYSHRYNEIYEDLASFQSDLGKLRQYIFDITGVMPNICRFPGGSSNTVSKVPMEDLIRYLSEEGITYYDWNVSCGDATGRDYSARQIADNVLEHIDEHGTSIVLMHDAADKTQTVEALPLIIEALLEREDVDILPITDDTVKVQHVVVQEEDVMTTDK